MIETMDYHLSSNITRRPYSRQTSPDIGILSSNNTYCAGSKSKCFHSDMGTSASSNGLFKPSMTSSLPGGYEGNHGYRYGHTSLDGLSKRYSEKNTAKTSPRQTRRGPLKADHNIGTPSLRETSTTYRNIHLTPLTKKRSNSMTDINLLNKNYSNPYCDGDYSNNNTEQQTGNKYGFSFAKFPAAVEHVRTGGESLTKKSGQILNGAKLKLTKLTQGTSSNRLHRRYSSTNDITAITDRTKQINILNAQTNNRLAHRHESLDNTQETIDKSTQGKKMVQKIINEEFKRHSSSASIKRRVSI